jgi:hypothetical protein
LRQFVQLLLREPLGDERRQQRHHDKVIGVPNDRNEVWDEVDRQCEIARRQRGNRPRDERQAPITNEKAGEDQSFVL